MVVAHTCSSRTWETEPEGLPQVKCHPGLHSEFQPTRELSFPKTWVRATELPHIRVAQANIFPENPIKDQGHLPQGWAIMPGWKNRQPGKGPSPPRSFKGWNFWLNKKAWASPQRQVLLSSGQRAQPPLTQVAAHCLSKTRVPGGRCP